MRSGAHEMAYPVSTYAPVAGRRRVPARLRARPTEHARRRLALLRAVELARRAARRPGRHPRGRRVARWHRRPHGARAARSGIDRPGLPVRHLGGRRQDRRHRHLLPRRQARRHVARDRRAARRTARARQRRAACEGIFPDDTGRAASPTARSGCATSTSTSTSRPRTCSSGCGRDCPRSGVVVFDDYGFPACPGVTQARQRAAHCSDDRLVLHNLNGHGLVVKR